MVVILCAFCSVIKRHELLPIAIWSNMTRIRQVAPLLHIINFNNLCFRVENKTTLISAKNRIDLSSISEVRSYITERPRFFGPPCKYR